MAGLGSKLVTLDSLKYVKDDIYASKAGYFEIRNNVLYLYTDSAKTKLLSSATLPVSTTDGSSIDLSKMTVKTRIDFDGNRTFKIGSETINYGRLHDIHLTNSDFAFIVYGDRAYLLSYVQDDPSLMREMRFQSVIATTDGNNISNVKVSGIYVKSTDGVNITSVTVTDINSENNGYKATAITDANKNDVWYPTTKAVADYVAANGSTKEDLLDFLDEYFRENPVGGQASVAGLKTILTDMVTFLKSVPFDDDTANASDLNALQNKINMLGGSDEPTDPVITLVSISATPNVTEYADGTLAKDLDLTVKAHYSDGNIITIEDYEINGIVTAGENTFTVSYGGKSTTVTVTGIAVKGETDVEMDATTFLYMGINVYTDDGQTEWSGTPAISATSSCSSWFSAEPFEKDGIVEYTLTNNTTANYRGLVFLGLVDAKPVKKPSVFTSKFTRYYPFKEYFGSVSDNYIQAGVSGTVSFPVKAGMYLVRFVHNSTSIIQDGLEQSFVFKEA